MKLNRRRFLATSAASSGLLITSCKTTDSQTKADQEVANLLVRKRWNPGQEDEFKAKFIKAIDWLKANDKEKFEDSDPRSYLTYNTIVKAHQNSCQHGNWFIFPWHRLYIQYFENACRFALQDASFTLPYWDWTLDRKIPEEFFHNPILTANRKMKEEDEIPEEFVAQKVIDDILTSDNFTSIHSRGPSPIGIRIGHGANLGAFERSPHNGVHNSIGGTMSNPTDSPNDPLFWLHHCNIDRIWAMWQARHPENLLPYKKEDDKTTVLAPPASTTPATAVLAPVPVLGRGGIIFGDVKPWEDNILGLSTVRDFSKDEAPKDLLRAIPDSAFNRSVAGSMSIKDILHIRDLGYTYDTIPKPLLAIQISKKFVVKRYPRRETNVEGVREVAADRLSSRIAWTSKESIEVLAQFKGRTDGYASLVAENLLGPADDALRSNMILRFFILTGKNTKIKPEFFARSVMDMPEYVGAHSFFGHPNPDRTNPDTTTAVDITRWLKKLLQREAVTDLQLVAIALNPKNEYKPVALFDSKSTANLKIEFQFIDV